MNNIQFNPSEVCNINVGVMGHVDSGKTSLGIRIVSSLSFSKIA